MTLKLAVVTGGTRGIGAAISIALKNHGYTVVANYCSNHETAKMFAANTQINIKNWDVANYEECKHAVQEIEQQLKTNIGVLINNAGIVRDSMMHKMTEHAWHTVLSTNLTSTFNMCSAVIKQMRHQKYGRIINISSVNGQIGQLGQTNYSAAKGGMIGFTKSLARESARCGITVNCVAPGYIKTDMTSSMSQEVLDHIVSSIPVGRLGTPEDIARAVLFLCDENADFITGETISVNGGYNMY